VVHLGDVAELSRVPLSVNKTAAFSNDCVTLSKRFAGNDVRLHFISFVSITMETCSNCFAIGLATTYAFFTLVTDPVFCRVVVLSAQDQCEILDHRDDDDLHRYDDDFVGHS